VSPYDSSSAAVAGGKLLTALEVTAAAVVVVEAEVTTAAAAAAFLAATSAKEAAASSSATHALVKPVWGFLDTTHDCHGAGDVQTPGRVPRHAPQKHESLDHQHWMGTLIAPSVAGA